MKSILHIIPSLNSGGAELYCIELCNYLAKENFNITILTKEKKIKKVINSKIKISFLDVESKNPIKIFSAVLFLSSFLKQNKFDAIHTHSRVPAIIMFFIKKYFHKSIKTFHTLHGLYKLETAFDFWYNSFSFKADKLLSVSNYTTRYFINHFMIEDDEQRITTINSGINLEDRKSVV